MFYNPHIVPRSEREYHWVRNFAQGGGAGCLLGAGGEPEGCDSDEGGLLAEKCC